MLDCIFAEAVGDGNIIPSAADAATFCSTPLAFPGNKFSELLRLLDKTKNDRFLRLFRLHHTDLPGRVRGFNPLCAGE